MDVDAVIKNCSKDFIWILENLFVFSSRVFDNRDPLFTHLLIVTVLIRLRTLFQFNWNRTPVIVVHLNFN